MKKIFLGLFVILSFIGRSQEDISYSELTSGISNIDNFIENLTMKGYIVIEENDYYIRFNKTGKSDEWVEKEGKSFPILMYVSFVTISGDGIHLKFADTEISKNYQILINEIKKNCTKIDSKYDESGKYFEYKYESKTLTFKFYTRSKNENSGQIISFISISSKE